MVICKRHIAALIVCSAYGCLASFAEDLTLAQPLQGSGEPLHSYLFVRDEGEPIAMIRGRVVGGGLGDEALLVGRMQNHQPGQQPSAFMGIVESSDGTLTAGAQALDLVGIEGTAHMTLEQIRARTAELRKRIEDARQAEKREAHSLQKINAEANELLKLERAIGGPQPEVDNGAQRERGKDLSLMAKQHLESIRTQAQPPAFKKREAELSEQLNVMASALQGTNTAGGHNAGEISPELQEKLDLIEATKDEHIDLLRRELAELKRRRAEVESAGPAAQQPREEERAE